MTQTAAPLGLAEHLCPALPQTQLDTLGCTVAESSFLAVAAVVIVLGVVVALIRRYRAARAKRSRIPQIVFPMQKGPRPASNSRPLASTPWPAAAGRQAAGTSAANESFEPAGPATDRSPAGRAEPGMAERQEAATPTANPATAQRAAGERRVNGAEAADGRADTGEAPPADAGAESFADPEPAVSSEPPTDDRSTDELAADPVDTVPWPVAAAPDGARSKPAQHAAESGPAEAARDEAAPADPAAAKRFRSAAQPGPATAAAAARAEPSLVSDVEEIDRRWVDAGPVRFERPPEGTLQLLPGRLEIRSGEGRGQEIRFIRAPGSPAEITFGRSTGPAYRHIQLRVPTVSRLHAELRFQAGVWTIRNLSSTNPTVVNGHALGSGLEEATLQDGDQIEMGEVVFTFRQPEIQDRLSFRSSWHTDRGLRPTNQDVVVVRTIADQREIAAVGDGMGSHEAGGEASRLAIEALVKACQDGQDLLGGVKRANDAVRVAANGNPERDGMGTTLVALLREQDRYWIANVGDSRAYRIDASGIRQITRDHSFMAEAARTGELSAEEAARSPWRNAVTRNLGATTEVEVDMFGDYSALEPHVVVLCSDGIHRVVDQETVERLVRAAPDIRDVARILCEEAIRCEGEDNVAAAAIAFGGGLGGHDPRPA